ncbi:SAM pointed domain-containing Ets transcription factor [Octopus vulgaris]|nr:SAM pointed domain-containing Ets transcription factor [Octopus vulgaris]
MEKMSSLDLPEYENQDKGTEKNFDIKTENNDSSFHENLLNLLQETNNLLFYPNFDGIGNVSNCTSQENNDSKDLKLLSLLSQKDLPEINSKNIVTDIEMEDQMEIKSELNDVVIKPSCGNLLAINEGGNSFHVSSFEDFIPSIESELNNCDQSGNCSPSSSCPLQISNYKINSTDSPLPEDNYSCTDDNCICGWSMKPPKYWNKDDIQNWMSYIAKVYDITLESKNFEDITSGKQLKKMTSKEFQQRDFIYGDWIHNMLKKMFDQVTSLNSGTSKDTLSPFTSKNEDKFNSFFSNLFNENLCTMSLLPLYAFIYAALKHSLFNPKILRWENEKSGTFQFIDPEKFAKLWGLTKNNNNMNYEKLSRSLRHYYPKRILKRVGGKRLIYKFLEPYFTYLKRKVNFSSH